MPDKNVDAREVSDPREIVGDAVAVAAARGAEFLDIAKDSVVLINTDSGPRIRLEHIPAESGALTRAEWDALADAVRKINDALDADLVSVTPGISTLELKDVRAAYELLSPGYIDWDALDRRSNDPAFGKIGPMASLGWQWFPPGPTIIFTKAETDAITVAIEVGATVIIAGILTSGGLSGPVAGPIALAIVLAGLAFVLCRAASKTGQVGLKYQLFPTPVVIPFPV